MVHYLRVYDIVHKSIDTVLLVVADDAHGLFTHSTLVSVTRRLVVMRVRNQSSTRTCKTLKHLT